MSAASPDWHLPTAEEFSDKAIIRSANQISNQAFEEIAQKLELRGIRTPISQIIGFSQFAPQAAGRIDASENNAGTSYGDLATVGPQLTALSDGQYLLIYGCYIGGTGGATIPFYAPDVNGAGAADADAFPAVPVDGVSVFVAQKQLAGGGNNTVTMRYRRNNTTSNPSFQKRWLVALRYANL